jgi:hypothetical protein
VLRRFATAQEADGPVEGSDPELQYLELDIESGPKESECDAEQTTAAATMMLLNDVYFKRVAWSSMS